MLAWCETSFGGASFFSRRGQGQRSAIPIAQNVLFSRVYPLRLAAIHRSQDSSRGVQASFICVAIVHTMYTYTYTCCVYTRAYINVPRVERLVQRDVEKGREREKMYPSNQLDPGSCPSLDIAGNVGNPDRRVPLHLAGPHR